MVGRKTKLSKMKYKVEYRWGPGIWRVINEIEDSVLLLGGKVTHYAWGNAPYTEYELPPFAKVKKRRFGSGPCNGFIPDVITRPA